MHFEGPRTMKEIPLPQIPIPDMSPVDPEKEGYARIYKHEFNISVDNKPLNCVVTFERTGQNSYPVEIAIESFNSQDDPYEDRMSSFKAVLNNDENSRFQHQTSDKKFHSHWQIHTRRIDKSLRHKGFGTWNMQLLEQIIHQVAKQYPELSADWIELETRLGSISNLVTKPELGYIPHPQDVESAEKLLNQTTEELDDTDNQPPVTFIKILNPNFNMDQFQVSNNPFNY